MTFDYSIYLVTDRTCMSTATLCEAVQIPIVVIGGSHKANAAKFAKLGVDGLAVVSAIIAQPDIQQAASELKYAFVKASLQTQCRSYHIK